MQQAGILNDDGIRLHDRFAQPYLLVGNAAEGHHRSAGALGAEAGESLRMTAFLEGGNRKHFCSGDNTLPAAPMNTYLEHGSPVLFYADNITPYPGKI